MKRSEVLNELETLLDSFKYETVTGKDTNSKDKASIILNKLEKLRMITPPLLPPSVLPDNHYSIHAWENE